MNKYFKTIIYVVAGFIFILPAVAQAATLSIEGPTELAVGDVANVDVVIDTEGESINAVSGTFRGFNTRLRLESFHDGVTLPKLWLEKPEPGAETAVFSGIIPGGFSGKGILARFVVRAHEVGSVTLALSEISILQNDGAGTPLPVFIPPPIGIVTTSDSLGEVSDEGSDQEKIYTQAFPGDLTPPEPFEIMFLEDDVLGKVAIFATQDKGSGISHFEVQENFFDFVRDSRWTQTESPYVLKGNAYVFVKAVDNAGNARVVEVYAGNRFAELGVYGILVVLAFGALLFLRRLQTM